MEVRTAYSPQEGKEKKARYLLPESGSYPLSCGGTLVFKDFQPQYVTCSRKPLDKSALLAAARECYGLELCLAEWYLANLTDTHATARVRRWRLLD